MEFKVNEKVVISETKEVVTIAKIIDTYYNIYGVYGTKDDEDKKTMYAYLENELEKFNEFIYPSVELTAGKRTNIISRTSCSGKESIIKFEIEKNIIKFELSKSPLCLQGLLKILLNEIDIHSYKYDRISPFKLTQNFIDKEHVFRIVYPDMRQINKTDEYILSVDLILKTNCNMQVTAGSYEIFIPNLIELAKFKNVLLLETDGTQKIRGIENEMKRCKYLNIDKESYINEMIKRGFAIPQKFIDNTENMEHEYLQKIIDTLDKYNLNA